MKRHAIKDTQSPATWDCKSFAAVGPMLGHIRNETPSGFDWSTKAFKSMTRQELMSRVNSRLLKDERPITVNIIANLETPGKLVYGGYMMRIHQVARALRLKIELSK